MSHDAYAGDAHDELLRAAVRAQHEDRAHGPWHRRRGLVVAVAVVAVALVAVVTDLPAPASRTSEISAATAVIHDVNTDIRPCTYAVTQAAGILSLREANALPASRRSQVTTMLGDDQVACSVINSSILGISEIDVPGSAVGHTLGQLVSTASTWAIQDALGVVAAVQTLVVHPHDQVALVALHRDLARLDADRTAAVRSVRDADAMLGATLPSVALPRVTVTFGSP